MLYWTVFCKIIKNVWIKYPSIRYKYHVHSPNKFLKDLSIICIQVKIISSYKIIKYTLILYCIRYWTFTFFRMFLHNHMLYKYVYTYHPLHCMYLPQTCEYEMLLSSYRTMSFSLAFAAVWSLVPWNINFLLASRYVVYIKISFYKYTFLLNFLTLAPSRFISRISFSFSSFSSEPQTSKALCSICKWRYNFISPQFTLWGFFRMIYFSAGSRLSRSQSFSKYSCLASVLVIKECFPSLSLEQWYNNCDFSRLLINK